MDTDRENFWILALLSAFVAMLFAVVIYEMTRPTIELNKDEWICTRNETRIVWQTNGKTSYPTPLNVCLTWQRAGSF